MAIYKHTYKNYTGARTETWSRFLILTRFGFARVYQSNFLLLFILACLFYPLACAAYIYLSHQCSISRGVEHSRKTAAAD